MTPIPQIRCNKETPNRVGGPSLWLLSLKILGTSVQAEVLGSNTTGRLSSGLFDCRQM
jgi:hypothetical protein